MTIAFTEKESPTLIQDQRRGRVFSRGEFVVEAGAGRVRRTLLTAKSDSLRLELTTTYEANDRLGILVPTLFQESSTRTAELEDTRFGGGIRTSRLRSEVQQLSPLRDERQGQVSVRCHPWMLTAALS